MKKAFTLIELLLYVMIIGIVLSSLVPFAWNVVGGGVKNAVQEEVVATARNVMEKIKFKIRNAKDISAISVNSITLTNYSGANTIIDLSAGKVRINEGAAVNLNSDQTYVTSLVFTDFTTWDYKSKNIQVQMTMTDNFTNTRQEYAKSIQLQTSAEIRYQ